MDEIEILNLFFNFIEFPFQANELFRETGQRSVYRGVAALSPNQSLIVKVGQNMTSTDIARFEREVKILQKLDSHYFPKIQDIRIISKSNIDGFAEENPNIQRVRSRIFDKLFSGPFVITIEKYIEHRSWKDVFGKTITNYAFFIEFFEKIFDALNLIWQAQVVHRDLKPDNILITTNLDPIIIDFGAAKSLRVGTRQLTGPSGALLTAYYASPEQIEVFRHSEVSYKSDQFSIGVIMFEILTGKHPYLEEDDNLDTYKSKLKNGELNTTLLQETDCPEALQEFVLKLIGNRPHKRFKNFDSIKDAIIKIKGEMQ